MNATVPKDKESERAYTLAIRARGALLRRVPWYGFLAMRFGEPIISRGITATAATDGRRLVLNPDFFCKLSEDQRIGLLAHETSHPALGHPFRRGGREADLWNQAADHAINLMLIDTGFQLPEGGCYDPRFKGLGAERIYEILKKERDDAVAQGQPAKAGKPGFDDHGLWGTSLDSGSDGDGDKEKSESEGKGKSKPTLPKPDQKGGAAGDQNQTPDPSQDTDGDGTGKGEDDTDEGDTGGIAGTNEVDAADERLFREWQRAAHEASTACAMAGNLPAGIKQAVDAVRAEIPWKRRVERWAKRRLSAGYNHDRYDLRWWVSARVLCERWGKPRPSAVVFLDNSGSISWKALMRGFGEARAIIDAVGGATVRLVVGDAKIQFDKILRKGDPLPPEVTGGGGTSFLELFETVGRESDICIMFTDCDGTWPDRRPPVPVCVVRVGSHKADPPKWVDEMIDVEVS